ncbi:MAG: hypothetical protein ACRC8A_17280 [Microcoleaceae cyanobacterium]
MYSLQPQLYPRPVLLDGVVPLRNRGSLRTLSRSITYSKGQFCLILARCNALCMRQQILHQLQRQCPVHLHELVLDQSTETLYTTICRELQSQQPEALIVTGLESVKDLSRLLTATNCVREEFCKFPFPIVLWVTDDVMKQLIRVVPDFFGWASTGIEFVNYDESFNI